MQLVEKLFLVTNSMYISHYIVMGMTASGYEWRLEREQPVDSVIHTLGREMVIVCSGHTFSG